MYPFTDKTDIEPETKGVETRNVSWQITAGPDGKLSPEQVTHALLIDIREGVQSIRKMLVFFTVIVVIALVVEILASLARV